MHTSRCLWMPKSSQSVIVRMRPHQCACLCMGVHMWERECLKVCPCVRVKVRMRLQRGVQVGYAHEACITLPL